MISTLLSRWLVFIHLYFYFAIKIKQYSNFIQSVFFVFILIFFHGELVGRNRNVQKELSFTKLLLMGGNIKRFSFIY